MRRVPKFRYFIGFRADLALRGWLSALAIAAGQIRHQVPREYLHLTLCVVLETMERDLFIRSRVLAALAGHSFCSVPIRLGRVRGGAGGAAVHTKGRQTEIQAFYRELERLLVVRNIVLHHRKSGLNPHVTLGYDPCVFDPYDVARHWFPDSLLLIESEIGETTHNVLAEWPLLPPVQGSLPFELLAGSAFSLAS